MRVVLLFATAAIAGCQDRPDTFIVPLAELDAEVQLGDDDRYSFSGDRMIRLIAEREPCLVLSPRDTRVTVDGTPGEMDPGYPEYDNRECFGPAMVFDTIPDASGPSTFEITDGSATWTFVIWEPFAYPDFELASPTAPARVGDTITLHVDLVGTMTSARVEARDEDFATVFELDDTSGVTFADGDVSFVLPDVSATLATIQLQVHADYELIIDRCDAPRGCRPAAPQPAFSRIDLAIDHTPP